MTQNYCYKKKLTQKLSIVFIQTLIKKSYHKHYRQKHSMTKKSHEKTILSEKSYDKNISISNFRCLQSN